MTVSSNPIKSLLQDGTLNGPGHRGDPPGSPSKSALSRKVPSTMTAITHVADAPAADVETTAAAAIRNNSPKRMVVDPVCNYDENPSKLYMYLEKSMWEKASARLQSHPHEVRTWVLRNNPDGTVRWKLLPLHAAIIFQSPMPIIQSLLDAYGIATSKQDDQGMLPLHLAFRHNYQDEALLELLLLHYPKGVHVLDRKDRLPLEHGREGRYSAKVVKLYSDSAVATAMNAGYTREPNNSSPSNGSNQNRRSDAGKDEYERKLAKQKTEYEENLMAMEEKHKKKMKELQDQKQYSDNALRNLQKTMKDFGSIKELISAGPEDPGQEKTERDILANIVAGMSDHNEELMKSLRSMKADQQKFRRLLHKQQEELKTSRRLRGELLHALTKQQEIEAKRPTLSGEMEALLDNLDHQAKVALSLTPRSEPYSSRRKRDFSHRTDKYHLDDIDNDGISAITEVTGTTIDDEDP